MKRKLIVPFLISSVLALSIGLSGCGSFGSAGPISDEYVEVSKYKGLEVPIVEKTTISDEDVENTIQQTLESNVIYNPVDREAKDGDQVNIDFVGKIKGVAFEGGTSEGYDLVLGSGSFISAEGKYKGFEEQIVGHKKGDKFDITVKFPAEYSEAVAGKVATFSITLNEVKEEATPELTDEYVSSTLSTTSKTVDEYRAEVKTQLQTEADENYDNTLKNEVYTEFLANVKIVGELDDEIEEEYQNQIQVYEYYAQMYGVDTETLLTQMGVSEDTLRESASRGVAFKHACALVADKCGLTLSDTKFKERATELAKEQGYTDIEASEADTSVEGSTGTEAQSAYDQFIAAYGEDYIRSYFEQQDVIEYLVKYCKQTADATTATEKTEETESSSEAATEAATEATTEAK